MSWTTSLKPSDGTQVFAMDDGEFDRLVRQTEDLDAINAAWGYPGQGIKHATPADRAAIEARLLIQSQTLGTPNLSKPLVTGGDHV